MSNPDPIDGAERVVLARGSTRVEVCPALGGTVTRFCTETPVGFVDWFRSAPETGPFLPTEAACFPLVPFSNRIRDGRFPFQGRLISLPRNHPTIMHALHGHGWRVSWRLDVQSASSATLRYDHAPGAWPWRYRAEQHFSVGDGGLEITLGVTNLGSGAMPLSFGLHPYFPRTPLTRLQAQVSGVWLTDADVLPLRHALVPAAWPISTGINPSAVSLDHGFTGFAGRAVISWPERQARLTVEAGPAFAHLSVYAPPNATFFCVEPVSAATDAANLAAQGATATGLRILGEGESVSETVRFIPEPI